MSDIVKKLVHENLTGYVDEEFIINQNKLFFKKPFPPTKTILINKRKVYAIFGEIEYYSDNNKDVIKAIKNLSKIITKDENSYREFLIEFAKRFNSIPELSSSEIILGVETSSKLLSELANSTNHKFVENAFVKVDKNIRMKEINPKDRGQIENLFKIMFDLSNNDNLCVIDDFTTSGTSFKNAFNLIPSEIPVVGVCLFKLNP